MRAAIYARVSTPRQARDRKTDQQVARLEHYAEQKGWALDDGRVYLDEGHSGASLNRPGLDALRDAAAMAEFEVVLVAAPDRLARKYVHQVLLLEELQGRGCRVEFLERPMSQDPNDQLLLQIRGAVAEYERTLIAERMRRGRLAKLRAGQLLPWMRVPFGYRTDPERPRDPQGLRVEEYEAAIVRQMFAWYLEQGATLGGVARRLVGAGVLTPTGKRSWSRSTIRGILKNPAYVGNAYGHCTRLVPAKARRSPLGPVGAGLTAKRRPEEEWIGVSVPEIVERETFDLVQEKLSQNRKFASRNNKSHRYLLRTLVSCGACGQGSNARTSWDGRSYYVCRGHGEIVAEQRCQARHAPGAQLDELVWEDLCEVLTHPEHVEHALRRAHGGEWLPQELKARLESVGKALAHTERQRERLLDAYLGGVLELAEFERKRKELEGRADALLAQKRQLEAAAGERTELAGIADSIEGFCEQVRAGLANATFEQKRRLVELLIDRVIVSDEEVEIRYVVPTSPEGPHQPFCHLRTDYLDRLPGRILARQHPPRTPAPKQVKDGVRDVPLRPLRRTATLFGRGEQRFEDGPLLVGEVGRVARWGQDGLRASGERTSASYFDGRQKRRNPSLQNSLYTDAGVIAQDFPGCPSLVVPERVPYRTGSTVGISTVVKLSSEGSKAGY
ncbi:MAG: recombinase family protein [Rubrobacter sp.]|nr:recombinase family protein [Rubrobacter sp.]